VDPPGLSEGGAAIQGLHGIHWDSPHGGLPPPPTIHTDSLLSVCLSAVCMSVCLSCGFPVSNLHDLYFLKFHCILNPFEKTVVNSNLRLTKDISILCFRFDCLQDFIICTYLWLFFLHSVFLR
jgi:hypothetical protein